MKGGVILLSREELPLATVPGNEVIGLQFRQGLDHPRDEGIVLPFLHGVDFGLDLSSIVRDIRAGIVLD